jgi:hypothetical protein
MVTLRARLALRKGTYGQKDPTRDSVERGACKGWAFGEDHHTKPKGSQGVKNRDVKEQLRLRSERTPSRICGKIRLDIGKRIARSYVTTWKVWNRTSLRSPPPLRRKIKEWTLWRGRPPPKGRKLTSAAGVGKAGDGVTPATVREDRKEKSGQQEDCDLSGSARKLAVSCSGRAPLRRERE